MREVAYRAPLRRLPWHANDLPDGDLLFFPLERRPLLVPLAPAGGDVKPEDCVCLQFDGSRGLYIHPNISIGPTAIMRP